MLGAAAEPLHVPEADYDYSDDNNHDTDNYDDNDSDQIEEETKGAQGVGGLSRARDHMQL